MNPGKAYSVLKTMGAQPGDCIDDLTFTLPFHQTDNLTDKQSAESNEYDPLEVDSLPESSTLFQLRLLLQNLTVIKKLLQHTNLNQQYQVTSPVKS